MDGVDLTTQASARVDFRGTAPRAPVRRRLRVSAKLLSFLLFVVAPTAVVATYVFGFAAEQYVSEAKFVVRGPVTQSPGMLSGLLATAGVTRAQDDAYAVQDYMLSRDALTVLEKAQGLRTLFQTPEGDLLSRFPQPFRGETFEHFYEYYLKHVEVNLDSSTGVSTLTVRMFRAEDAQRIAAALMGAGEALVNQMNERQRENTMRDARKDVELSEVRVQNVATQIAQFRNREAVLDPTKQSVPLLQGITDLQTMLSRTNLQLAQLKVSAPNSPLIADYQRRAAALNQQITELKAKVTGGDASMVPKITEYDMLSLQREFADKQLASAIASLETARIQAERQQLYLDEIVKPNEADYAAYPKRFVSTAIAFCTFLGIYLMASLLIAGAREHRFV